ncbi:MAG: hypothetical protein F4X57_08135 [Chloroflexi bacterium]|nr:hypothetical protein [Chloroflexota bacterium]
MRLLTMVLLATLLFTLAAFPACAQSPSNPTTVEPAVEPAAASEEEPSEPEEEETLLLRYYPPPPELPKVQLVSDGPVKSAADGIILSADWDFADAHVTRVNGVSLPFIWPEASAIDPAQSVIRFHTDIEPGYVFVEGYAVLRPDDIGESPSVSGDFGKFQEPAAEYECTRFQVDPCMRAGPGNSVEIYGIPAELLELPHLLVFAKWNIDPEEDPEGVAIANWAWHITVRAAQKP